MKQYLSAVVCAVAVVAFAAAGVAQEKKAAPGDKAAAKVQEVTGEVTAVDAAAKKITLNVKGKKVALDAAEIKELAKIKAGDWVVAEYAEAGGKLSAKSVKAAKKPAAKAEPAKETKPADKAKAPGYK